jgi:hypothetical protein
MNHKSVARSRRESVGLVRCSGCKHFTQFYNEKGHNSPHALGKCKDASWDGNMGQWAMFQHPCKNYMAPNDERT